MNAITIPINEFIALFRILRMLNWLLLLHVGLITWLVHSWLLLLWRSVVFISACAFLKVATISLVFTRYVSFPARFRRILLWICAKNLRLRLLLGYDPLWLPKVTLTLHLIIVSRTNPVWARWVWKSACCICTSLWLFNIPTLSFYPGKTALLSMTASTTTTKSSLASVRSTSASISTSLIVLLILELSKLLWLTKSSLILLTELRLVHL